MSYCKGRKPRTRKDLERRGKSPNLWRENDENLDDNFVFRNHENKKMLKEVSEAFELLKESIT